MKKKLLITLAVFLALVMACSFLALPALAVDTGDKVVTATKTVDGPDGEGNYTVTLSVTGSTYQTSTTEEYPADVVLCLDYSGSMRGNKILNVRETAATFINSLTEKDIQVGLVLFARTVRDSQTLTTNAGTLTGKLALDPTDGTNYGVGLSKAKEILDDDQREGVKKFVVFLSDGEPQVYLGQEYTGESAFNSLNKAGVTVMTIGFDLGTDQSGDNAINALMSISSPTGNEPPNDKHFYEASNNQNALNAVFAALEETITNFLPRAKDVVMTDIVNGEFFDVVAGSYGNELSFNSDAEAGPTFSWDIGDLGSVSKTVTFKIKPKAGWIGTQLTNNDVSVTYKDAENGTQGGLEKDDIGNPTVTIPGIIIKKTISPAGFAAPEGLAFEIKSESGMVATVYYKDFNNNGEGVVRLSPGTYSVTESGAEVGGYTLTTVYGNGTPAASGTVTVPADGDGVASLNVTNTYELATGSLKITKEFKGLPQGANYGEITFTVKDSKGNNYKAFTYGGEGWSNGSYMLTGVPIGTYTVTESGGALAGYTLNASFDKEKYEVKTGETATVTVTNTYTRDTGTLVIRKQFGRESALDALPDGAKFTVTGPADFGENGTMVILWSEFANGAKTLTVPTGSYKVTESGAEAAGCTLSTAYDPEVSTPDGPAGSARVAKNGTATVTVTNTYTRDKGTLTIEKTFGRESALYDLPSGAKFVVSGPADFGEEGTMTIPYSDFDDGKWSQQVPTGDYTVVEKDAEVNGYTLTTAYTPAATTPTGTVGSARVLKDAEATVTVTNTYTKDGGHVTPVSPVLNTEDHYAYIVGYPDGTVGPSREITRAEVSTIFFRMLTDEARAANWSTDNSFPDVSAGSWYNNAVSTLVKMGIVHGYPDGTFRPDSPVTRAELVTMSVGFFQYDAAADSGRFSDIAGHWAKSDILAAAKMGFIDGYPDGTFRPDNNITRAEAVRIINNVLNRAPHKDHLLREMVTWPDNMDRSRWYYADIQEATNSHEYTWSSGKKYEIWSKLLPVRDWVALEKAWEANAATNPGEVMGD